MLRQFKEIVDVVGQAWKVYDTYLTTVSYHRI